MAITFCKPSFLTFQFLSANSSRRASVIFGLTVKYTCAYSEYCIYSKSMHKKLNTHDLKVPKGLHTPPMSPFEAQVGILWPRGIF